MTPAEPGLGERSGPDHAFFEFDILGPDAGVDNARMVATAIPALLADIDLYLQKQKSDGTWGPDYPGVGGGSFDLARETINAGRLNPGHWRIEVVNYAGAPATRVDLTIDFFNRRTRRDRRSIAERGGRRVRGRPPGRPSLFTRP